MFVERVKTITIRATCFPCCTMKKLLLLLCSTLILGGCKTSGNTTVSSICKNFMDNPLYAERYAEELVNQMVELTIYENPVLEDEGKKKIADTTRQQWLEVARAARAAQRKGSEGEFISVEEFVQGNALLLQNAVYLGTAFDTEPGPDLHLYLTTVVDPRGVEFPDNTSIDLGVLQTPYGAQQYDIPGTEPIEVATYRTLVLWDNALERVHGFAQMSIN